METIRRHAFQRTDQTLYTDQHGCCGTLNDSTHINGTLYFQWDNKIFEITRAEAHEGFTIAERD